MAKIEWEDQAKFQFRHYVKNAITTNTPTPFLLSISGIQNVILKTWLEELSKTMLGATDQYKNLSEHRCWLRWIMINEIQKING